MKSAIARPQLSLLAMSKTSIFSTKCSSAPVESGGDLVALAASCTPALANEVDAVGGIRGAKRGFPGDPLDQAKTVDAGLVHALGKLRRRFLKRRLVGEIDWNGFRRV